MRDPQPPRPAGSWSLAGPGLPHDLDGLTDLGALHLMVLDLLAEAIKRLHEAGFTKDQIHLALSDDAVLARSRLEHVGAGDDEIA